MPAHCEGGGERVVERESGEEGRKGGGSRWKREKEKEKEGERGREELYIHKKLYTQSLKLLPTYLLSTPSIHISTIFINTI